MQNRNFYNRHPEYLENLPEQYRANLVTQNESTDQYMRMPLMLLKAEQLVGGEEKMDAILAKIYADRANYSYEEPLTYVDFLSYCDLTEEALILE